MADDFSLDDGFISRLFQIESGGDPAAVTGSNRGLGQFSPDLERKYGITDWQNYGQQAAAVRQEMAEFAPSLAKTLGRTPTAGELYLAHQQGLAGAQAHLNNPDGTAWQNVKKYYPSDAVARSAIWGNIPSNPRTSPNFNKAMFPGGVDDVTSGDFANGWIAKFEGGAAPQFANNSTPASTPVAAPGQQLPAGGLLAGAGITAPTANNPDVAAIGRIASLFNQPAAQPQARSPQFRPIQMPVPAGIRAQLIAAALRNRGYV